MGFLSSLFSGIGNLVGGATKGIGSLFGSGGGNLLGGIGSLFGSLFGGGQQQAPKVSSPNIGHSMSGLSNRYQPSGGSGNFLDNIFPGGKASGVAGMAIPAIGNMFGPKPSKVPDFNSLGSVQAMQSFRPGNSVSPQYKTMLTNNTNRLRDKRIQDLQATYRSAHPGTDYLTDTNYQRDLAEVERQVQGQMSDDLAKAEGTFSQQEQERLSQIAQMDIYSIMAQTGLDAQEANNFKQMFSNVGNMFLTNATKKPNQFEDMMSLFGGR